MELVSTNDITIEQGFDTTRNDLESLQVGGGLFKKSTAPMVCFLFEDFDIISIPLVLSPVSIISVDNYRDG